jgi:hypothetical protein
MMKVMFVSDIHCHVKNRDKIVKFSNDNAGNVDVLILLGDIAEDVGSFYFCLDEMSKISDKRYCVLGNHDIYRNSGYDSKSLMIKVLKSTAVELNYCYGNGIFKIGNSAFVVNSCSHNLSFCPPDLAMDKEKMVMEYERVICDHKNTSIGYSELFEMNYEDFRISMIYMEDIYRNGMKRFFIGTHWPIISEAYVPFIRPEHRHLLNDKEFVRKHQSYSDSAFMSPEYGDLLFETLSKLNGVKTTVVSGHTHQGREISVKRGDVCIDNVIIDAGYEKMGARVFEFD